MSTLRAVLVLLPTVLLLASARAADDAERRQRVFRRVQDAVHAPQTPHFNARDVQLTTLVRKAVPESGRPITMPVLPPGCGMGVFGGLDAEGALALAVDLFALYGYGLKPGLSAAGVRLDGLDAKAKVGFVLLPAALGDARLPVVDPSTRELSALEGAGYQVLVLPLDRYRCMQADTSTPTHACALTLVEFLADVTGTRPVDVAVLAKGQPTDVPGTGLEQGVEGATSFQVSETSAFVVLEGDAPVTLGFRPPSGLEGKGRPTLLTLPFYWIPPLKADGSGYDFAATPPSFTLVQEGMAPLRSGRAVFLTDGGFDPAKPFRILVTLRPGQTHVGREVRVRTSTGAVR